MDPNVFGSYSAPELDPKECKIKELDPNLDLNKVGSGSDAQHCG